MERGARELIKILAWALLVGAVVLATRDEYRGAVAALWRGEPEASPVWISNTAYYRNLPAEAPAGHED